jgi:predicted LPLAT superfamily acyltransferase
MSASAPGGRGRWTDRPEGGGRFALGLILRFALWFGRAPARLLLYPITLYFLLRRGPERRASRAYLARVLGRPARLLDVARHIHCFAATILDRVFLLSERFRRFRIATHGLEALHAVMDEGRGVLLFGAHVGSFEALRVLSLQRPDVKVRVLLDLGHNPVLTRIFAALNPAIAGTVIDARQDGTAIVLAIKEAVEANAIVTVLADRVRPGEGSVAAPFLGADAPFPTAPWLMAAVLKTPVVLCFGLYRGGNRYDLHFEVFERRVAVERLARERDLAALAARYAQRLEHYVRLAPYNWFNFYDFWQTPRDPVAAAGRADAGARA